MSVRIICADESPIVAAGVERLLQSISIDETTLVHSQEQLNDALERPWDALISEMRLGDIDTLEYLEARTTDSGVMQKVIVYTFHDNPTYAARSHAAGIFDFLLKRNGTAEMIESVSALLEGRLPKRTLLTRARNFLLSQHTVPNISPTILTKRELQILIHLSLGLSNREISTSLGISLETVKEHVQNVLRKLKVNDRTAAAVWAMRNNIPILDLES